MRTLQAKHDNIVVKPIDTSEAKYGNIVIPDAGKEKSLIVEVISVGPGRWSMTGDNFIKNTSEPGQIVYLPPVGAIRVEFDGDEYYICPESQVLAVIETK